MGKLEIIEGITILVSNNVIGDKQAENRFKGFRGELFLENYITEKYPFYKQLEGGIIISKNSTDTSLDNSIYITIIPKENLDEDYKNIYCSLAKLGFEKMFLVAYTNANWTKTPVMFFENETIQLWVPEMEIYEFKTESGNFKTTSNTTTVITSLFNSVEKRGKNIFPIEQSTTDMFTENMIQFSEIQLLKIYMNRLFLDGLIGFGKEKGKLSDIDLILKRPSGEFKLIEIKEKDLPKKNTKGFGLDVPRLKDMIRIATETKLEYHLVIREINNQTDRKLVGWKHIKIRDFANNVNWEEEIKGGTGMRSPNTYNPTLICPYRLFNDL